MEGQGSVLCTLKNLSTGDMEFERISALGILSEAIFVEFTIAYTHAITDKGRNCQTLTSEKHTRRVF